MTDTLYTATLRTAQALGATQAGKATGGTAGTLIDTRSLLQSDDYWNEGTVWVGKTTDQAAPQLEFGVVTDFSNSSATVTLADNLSASIDAGDFYHIASAKYPLYQIIDAINYVLSLQDIVIVDTTSLDTASSQTEYTLPAAVKRGGLLAVYVQMQTDDSDDNQWMQIHNWSVQPGTTGNQDTLIIPQFSGGRGIRIDYIGLHNNVYAYGDQIDEAVDIGALSLHAAVECMVKRMDREAPSKYMVNQYNRLAELAEKRTVLRFNPTYPTKFNIVRDADHQGLENPYGDSYR